MTISGVGSITNMIREKGGDTTVRNGSGSEGNGWLTVTRDRIIAIRVPLIRIK